MALTIARAIEEKAQVAIEAGTGTGKSLAYLVPLLLRKSFDETPAIIATKTIQLQHQLLHKDLPLLQELLQTPRKVVQAKGWSNYLCLRKIESPEETTVRLLGENMTRLRRLAATHAGKVAKQDADLPYHQWAHVKADPLDCQKRHCPQFHACGLFAERRELETAEVIVTNHAFLLSDLRLRREGRSLLPDGDVLIIDEAHRLDDVATDHLAIRFDADRVHSCITSPLLSGADGWLAATRFTFLMTLPEIDFQQWSDRFDRTVFSSLKDLDNACAELFFELQANIMGIGISPIALRPHLHSETGEQLANLISEVCMALRESADGLMSLCRDYEEGFQQSPPPELIRLAHSLERLSEDLEFLGACESPDWVYLLEPELQCLVARPIDNSEALEKELFSQFQTVIVTSASLKVNNSFHFFKKRTGLLKGVSEHSFESPFQIAKSTYTGLCNSGPEPGEADYADYLAPHFVNLACGLRGRMLILTTSHRRVREFTALLRPPLAQNGINLLVQGEGSPAQLLRRFSSSGEHVLIGVDSFWEGVDIPGERLSCVVMTRLPFPVPSDILFEARSRRIEEQGGYPFSDLSIPLVGLKLKQGFGRLLRSETDRGIFLLTDPRGQTKRYGKQIVKNLPVSKAQCGDIAQLVSQALDWSESNLEFPELRARPAVDI